MSTKSTARLTKYPEKRRRPSILSRKRKINSLESPSCSSSSISPISKHHCGNNGDGNTSFQSSENGSSPSVILASSSSVCIPSSQSKTSAHTDFSESDDHSSSLNEESVLLSPASPRPFRSLTCYSSPVCSTRHSPLPQLSWADHKVLWDIMIQKDAVYPRNSQLFLRHPQLQPRMRAILLEWLMEVCEVYKLHRETYYLAQDFIDRYLACQKGLPKQQLQLLGITCLFLASKIEEIYPPKLSEFSYVTDSACTEAEIIEKELVVLKVLNWDLTPLTVNAWLNIYLQLASSDGRQSFDFPYYPGIVLVKVAQLLDLCMLDIQALRFPYGIIAAAALYHTTNSRDIALGSSGLDWSELLDCVVWMKPFAQTIQEDATDVDIETFSNILPEDQHNIQTHTVDLQLLDKALLRQKEGLKDKRPSSSAADLLTPPKSSQRSISSESPDVHH